MIEQLKSFQSTALGLRKDIRSLNLDRVSKKHLKQCAEEIGSQWFADIKPLIEQHLGAREETLDKYDRVAERLLSLGEHNNLSKSYLEALDSLLKRFRSDFIIPSQKGSNEGQSISVLHKVIESLPDPVEGEYLDEAIKCAQRGFYRASVVLGWCATIDRMHRKIEDIGFTIFNVTSTKMASQKSGRYKRFNSPQNVSSLSELREVFDRNVLHIIEGMGLVDTNQNTRLISCFEMRNQAAHPGQAGFTEYNLMSFFSDINQIVLQNSTFKL